MAKDLTPKGSIIYKILILLLAAGLLFTILYPKNIWQKEEDNTKACRKNMEHILYAQLTYLTDNNAYEDTLAKVVDFIKSDSTQARLRTFITADSVLSFDIYEFFKTGKDSIAKTIVDSLLTFGRKYDIDTTAALVIDSLKTFPKYAQQIDSIAFSVLNNLHLCPSTLKPYLVSVNNDSTIKKITIACPLDSLDAEAVKKDFKLYFLGGLKLKNHGSIDNGEKSWKKL
ncbi:MAG TPA: hypothetical protein PLP19_03665 [bacterium]|nr:hypothetical protein [bacterium]HPN42565.1 hypothetical protein [bacterium]